MKESKRDKRGKYTRGIRTWNKRMKEPDLFHVTSRHNLRDIEKRGLQPDISELTQDAFLEHRAQEYESRGLSRERAFARAERDLDHLPDYVFAAESHEVPVAIFMLTENQIRPISNDDVVVLGIVWKDKKNFEDKEIACSIDRVSTKPVSPKNLRVMSRDDIRRIVRGERIR